MNKQNITLPSLRNTEWRTVNMKTESINQVPTYTPIKNITESNEVIYAGAKVVCGKIGIALKSTNKESKPEWEIRLETQIKIYENRLKC